MYTNTDLKIFEQIYILPGIHTRGLARNLKMGMPSINNGLKNTRSLIKKQKSGNQIKYSLNYSKDALTPALHCVEYSRLEQLPQKIKISIRDFLKELLHKPILSLLFGSYAKGNNTSASDIDILLVFQKTENTKEIEYTSKKISMQTNTKLNPIYVDYNIFRQSFHNPTKEFFKNIKKDKILLTGIEWWRQLEDEES